MEKTRVDRVQLVVAQKPDVERRVVREENLHAVANVNASFAKRRHFGCCTRGAIRREEEIVERRALFVGPRPVRNDRIFVDSQNRFPDGQICACRLLVFAPHNA